MLTVLAKLLKVLNSDDNPAQIAAAVVLAAFIGLSPLLSVHNALLLLLVLWLRVNLSLFLLSFLLFSGLAYALDPLSHQLGLALLQNASLEPLWTALYNIPLWRLLAFNNSLVLGSVALSALLALPLFFACVYAVRNYRERLRERVMNSRLGLMLKGSKLFGIYSSLNG